MCTDKPIGVWFHGAALSRLPSRLFATIVRQHTHTKCYCTYLIWVLKFYICILKSDWRRIALDALSHCHPLSVMHNPSTTPPQPRTGDTHLDGFQVRISHLHVRFFTYPSP